MMKTKSDSANLFFMNKSGRSGRFNKMISAAEGIVFILFGLLVLIYAEHSLLLFLQIAAIYVLFAGLAEVFRNIFAKEKNRGSTYRIFLGIIEIILAILALYYPAFALFKFVYVFGAILLLNGFLRIARRSQEQDNSRYNFAAGLLEMLAGAIMITSKGSLLVWLIGIIAIFIGMFILLQSFKKE